MKFMERTLLGFLVLATAAAFGQPKNSSRRNPSGASSKTVHADSADRGQQVFNRNCSRCHNPPQGFSPNISGTIAMHMRVRAGLSEADYKALLRFLNP